MTRFAIVLEPISTDDRPPAIRLRALLKFAIRALGLKCVEARELSTEPKPAVAKPEVSA